ncbi:MAG TPA: FHA domain-containing protein, partial [Pyrinomonadaceae bacterium]|nr:FHA domain-containing protein [Pyrinomonadaceae bacterium]
MADAKLKFNGSEITLGQGVTTLGRTTDNNVSFASDSNVSRYHAEIEWRDGDFWLIDLGSSNGTTLNGETVKGDKRLKNGDEILLGGTSKAEFSFGEKKTEETPAAIPREDSTVAGNEELEKKEEAEIVQDEQVTSKARMPALLGIAGGTVA